jgi:hypothetical protein
VAFNRRRLVVYQNSFLLLRKHNQSLPPPRSVEELVIGKGGDVLHPRLGRGRYLETEPHVNIVIFGQPRLFCCEHHGLKIRGKKKDESV